MRLDGTVTLMVNTISMHECRDIDEVAEKVKVALEPGGWFVISDFPPGHRRRLRSIPGRVMSGIQFFEAEIDDQLLAPGRLWRALGPPWLRRARIVLVEPVPRRDPRPHVSCRAGMSRRSPAAGWRRSRQYGAPMKKLLILIVLIALGSVAARKLKAV